MAGTGTGSGEGVVLPAIGAKRAASGGRYGFDVSPSGYKRRVNKDGLSMLEAIVEKQETEKQVRMLENRLKRLGYEDERANKKIQETQRKTEQMLRVKERRQNDLEHKLEMKKMQLSHMMDNRHKFVEEKDRRTSSINAALAEIRMRNNVGAGRLTHAADAAGDPGEPQAQQRGSGELQGRRARAQDRHAHGPAGQDPPQAAELPHEPVHARDLPARGLLQAPELQQGPLQAERHLRKPALNLQMKELEDKEAGMIEKLKHTFQAQQNSFHHFETVANSGKRPAYSPGATSPRGFFAPSQLNNDDAMSQRSQETARPEMGDRLGRLLDGEKKAKTELEEIEALLKMGGVSLIAQKLGKSSPRTGATSPRPVQVKSKKKETSVPAKKEPVKKPAAVPKAAPKPEPVVAAPPKAEPAPPKPAVVEESEAPAPAPPAKAEEPLSPEEENKPGDTELPAAQREALDEE